MSGNRTTTYYQLIQAANSSQTGPDVCDDACRHVRRPQIYRLARAAERPPDAGDARLDQGLGIGRREISIANGKIYGVPGNPVGMGLLLQQGAVHESRPRSGEAAQTWDELVAAAEALKDAGILPFGGGNADGWGDLQYLNIIFPGSFDAAASAALANGEIPYNGEAFKAVNQHLVTLAPPKASSIRAMRRCVLWTEGVQGFAAGQAAMIAGIASDTVSYNEFLPELGDDLGVFYAPAATRWPIPTSRSAQARSGA